MFTTGAKFFHALAAVALVAALGLGWTTGGGGLGPLSGGYKGGVGDHLGYTILVFTSAVSFFLGLVAAAFRDADPEATAQVAGTELPPAVAPTGVSYWPSLGAFGVGITVLGLVVSNVLFVIGLVVVGIVMVEWLVQAWAERATGDPATNRAIRNRIMYPFEIPLAGALTILLVVVSLSRVFLAVSPLGAVAVATSAAVLVLAVGTLVAQKPRIGSSTVAVLLFAGAVAVLTAGVIGAASGERDFHHGEENSDEEHSEDDGDDVEGGSEPVGDTPAEGD